jgi:hypothetical protein
MFDLMRCLLRRPVVGLQGDLGAPTSPSHMRSPDPTVMGEALADDARTVTPPWGETESRATSPPAADSRVDSPSHSIEAGGGANVGDVGAMTSPRVIDVDPISARPAGAEDLIKDQPQIDQAPGGPGTSGAQVPQSSPSSPRLLRQEINWNHTPWHDVIF